MPIEIGSKEKFLAGQDDSQPTMEEMLASIRRTIEKQEIDKTKQSDIIGKKQNESRNREEIFDQIRSVAAGSHDKFSSLGDSICFLLSKLSEEMRFLVEKIDELQDNYRKTQKNLTKIITQRDSLKQLYQDELSKNAKLVAEMEKLEEINGRLTIFGNVGNETETIKKLRRVFANYFHPDRAGHKENDPGYEINRENYMKFFDQLKKHEEKIRKRTA